MTRPFVTKGQTMLKAGLLLCRPSTPALQNYTGGPLSSPRGSRSLTICLHSAQVVRPMGDPGGQALALGAYMASTSARTAIIKQTMGALDFPKLLLSWEGFVEGAFFSEDLLITLHQPSFPLSYKFILSKEKLTGIKILLSICFLNMSRNFLPGLLYFLWDPLLVCHSSSKVARFNYADFHPKMLKLTPEKKISQVNSFD